MEEVILIAKLQAKPNHHEDLERELKMLAKSSCKEPECLLYALHRDADDPCRFVIIERWTSQKALDIHTSSPHFLRYRKYAVPILVGLPEREFLKPLGEGDKGKL